MYTRTPAEEMLQGQTPERFASLCLPAYVATVRPESGTGNLDIQKPSHTW
jgi:hypothetical protein